MDNLQNLSTRKETQIPVSEKVLELYKTYFFNREDRVLVKERGGERKPFRRDIKNEQELNELLHQHVYGSIFLGAYTPGPDNQTKWLGLDIDGGENHRNSVVNPKEVARSIFEQCHSYGISCYLEKSKSSEGYHVWIFFDEPIPAKEARALGLWLCPKDVVLRNEEIANPISHKGIEVFPKCVNLGNEGTGNCLWLPWAKCANEGGSLFYELDEEGELELIESPLHKFVRNSYQKVKDLILDFQIELPKENLFFVNPTPLNLILSDDYYTPVDRQQIDEFLKPLNLCLIYGSYLTTSSAGESRWQCHDPFKDGVDHTPSATVADGTGKEIKGFFYSHRPNGKHLQIWNYMVEIKMAKNKREALEMLSNWVNRPIPECLTPEVDTRRRLDMKLLEYNQEFAMVQYGNKFFVIYEYLDQNGNRTQSFLDVKDFKIKKMNDIVTYKEGQSEKNISFPEYWLKHPQRREYKQVIFDPNCHNPEFYNLYRGLSVEADANKSCRRLLQHIWENVCQEKQAYYDYLMAWLAHGVQKPGERPQTAVVIRGGKGTGKGTLVDAYGSLFGPHYCYTNDMNQVIGRFNALTLNALVINADEAYWPGLKDMEGRLKGLITDPKRTIECKGKDIIQIDNYIRLIITANEKWVVPASEDERRFFVLQMGDQHKQDLAYFRQIYDELNNGGRESFLHYLQQYDISSVDLKQIPQTHALLEQKLQSGSPVMKFWYERLQEGQLLPDHNGWVENVPKDNLYDFFWKNVKMSGYDKANWRSEFGKQLNDLCPSVEVKKISGRCFNPETGVYENKRVQHYVFPSLDICRREFDAFMHYSIEWSIQSEEEEVLFRLTDEDMDEEFSEL